MFENARRQSRRPIQTDSMADPGKYLFTPYEVGILRAEIQGVQMLKVFLFLVCALMINDSALADKNCFLAAEKDKIIDQQGDCRTRHACCSTFKIAISLMGYNEGILISETEPELPFKSGYYDLLDSWRQPHNPKLWMKNSCVWFSQVITKTMGLERFGKYVNDFEYGNRNISGDVGKNNGLTNSWLSSSLQISPVEQVAFLQKLVDGKLPVSPKAMEITKNILYIEELPTSWKLFGKTGSGNLLKDDGTRDVELQIGWFVGWLYKDTRAIVFAQFIQDETRQDTLAGKRAREAAIKKLIELTGSVDSEQK